MNINSKIYPNSSRYANNNSNIFGPGHSNNIKASKMKIKIHKKSGITLWN
jgi:hypothetical protein